MADDFEQQVANFAAEIGDLLWRTVCPRNGGIEFTVLNGRATVNLERQGLARAHADDMPEAPLDLEIGGERYAGLLVQYQLRPDSTGEHLAVLSSKFGLWSSLDRAPIIRLEFRDDMRREPASHWQVHAERGAMTHMLTVAGRLVAGRTTQHKFESIALPVGGARFRPCLEDFLQMIIEFCGVDPEDGWRLAIQEGRRRWRELQTKTIVRDAPELAAATLARLGYSVRPPADGHPDRRPETFERW